MKRTLLPALFALAVVGCSASSRAVEADDTKKKDEPVAASWTSWRGPEGTGVSRETGLPSKAVLKKGGENFVFAVPHSGLSSPVVLKGKVFVVGRVGEKETQQEVVQAFDAATGALAWEDKRNVWHTDIVDDRLGFTSVAADAETGNVYAHTTAGELVAYEGATGKIAWKRSLTEEFGRVSGYGGRVVSPMIDEDKVIVGMPNASWGEHTIGNTRLVAFDKKTGKVVWWASGNHAVKNTYHSMPVAAVIGGRRLILSGGGDGCLHAFLARTGERVWSHEFVDNHEAVNASPVVQGDKIWIGHGEENKGAGATQGRVVCIDGATVKDKKPKELWRVDGIKAKFATPCLHDGLLYVPDEAGKLYCLEADTGKELWTYDYGAATKGSPVWADGKLYVCEVDKKFHILEPSMNGCKELSTISFRGKGGVQVELHGTPAICDGRIYFTTTTQLVCIGKAAPAKVKIPAPVKETEKPGELAWIRVHPAEETLSPEGKASFKAFGYDKDGRALGEIEAEWSLAPMRPPVFPKGIKAPPPVKGAPMPPVLGGKLSAEKGKETELTASKLPPGQFGRVVAKVGKVSGEARVRVAPVLPFSIDFEKVPAGRTPGSWINTMGKYTVAAAPGGGQALKKRNDSSNPLLARANAYIGVPTLKDYTIEADIITNKVRGSMADMGIGAMRYSLTLMGNEQVLRLNTWDALYGGRVNKEMKFDFKPDTWYRMKLAASSKGEVRGKVWARGEKEPAEWTLEISDPVPNAEGAPLLYGYANGTIDAARPGPDAFFDNVKITKN
ncbi:MAG: PQQ-like beta-propeller repeat protein [Gemmataceae bacterium]|nr:PQQ-like beta-propeller repeat protein [Gemmataceae bacterium]